MIERYIPKPIIHWYSSLPVFPLGVSYLQPKQEQQQKVQLDKKIDQLLSGDQMNDREDIAITNPADQQFLDGVL